MTRTCLTREKKLKALQACKNCGLHLNQRPLIDKRYTADVIWVGLSAVLVPDHQEFEPLGSNTRSGALITSLESAFEKDLSFYKTNLVKCLPLRETGKIRYPSNCEMTKCFSNLKNEIKVLEPKVVFLLGKQVADFVFKQVFGHASVMSGAFDFKGKSFDGIFYVPIYHPSYMLVYKRKLMNKYFEGIGHILEDTLDAVNTELELS